MTELTIGDKTYTKMIGPCNFHSRYLPQKTESVYVILTEKGFYLLFTVEAEGQDFTVDRLVLEILYSHILLIDKRVKRMEIHTKEEPMWEFIYPPPKKSPRIQRYGFSTFSLVSKKSNLNILYNEIYKKSPALLLTSFFPPAAIFRDSMVSISEGVQFSVPRFFLEIIPDFMRNINTIFQRVKEKHGNDYIQHIFAEKYNFELEFSQERLVMEAIDPLYALKQALVVTYNRESVILYRFPFQININVDYAFLTGHEAEQFLIDPPSTVSIFISSATIGDVENNECMEVLNEFLNSPLYPKTEFIDIDESKAIRFGMTQIYGRETWVCPFISYQRMDPTLSILSINALKSDNFIKAIREMQPYGKFRKGVTSGYLPDCYYSIFTFEHNMRTIVNHIEIVGWDFDTELVNVNKRQFAILSSQKLGAFLSYLKMKKDIDR